MHVRIGISAGEVVLEESDVRGVPPTEAARLCARAEGGQILTTELVHQLATARSGAPPPQLAHQLATAHSAPRFRPLGAFDLKGLPGPTPLYEVSWPINGDETVPLPESLDIAAHEFAFVGRTREVEVLVEQWDATRATSALSSVIVTGEAGAGKSRLVTEFARSLVPDVRTVLYGRCDEVAGYPFQPIAE